MWLGPSCLFSLGVGPSRSGSAFPFRGSSSLTSGRVPSLCLQQASEAHIVILVLHKRELRRGWLRVGTQPRSPPVRCLPHKVVADRKGVRAEGPSIAPRSVQSSRKGAAWAKHTDRTCLWLADLGRWKC